MDRAIERYIIVEGRGRVEVPDFPAADVGPGDVVIIPAETRQRITHAGMVDLIFYRGCTRRFQAADYRSLKVSALEHSAHACR
ncbi:MAG TPA: hypothetical protein VE083_10770 [Terriglobales bacterium]|nr:hypothetical protein [Terriglobales bacterium]